MKLDRRAFHACLATVLALTLGGCLGYQTRLKSSVVDYLYPNQDAARAETSAPVLQLPLDIGIAFVPEQSSGRRGSSGVWTNWAGEGVLSEATRQQLLEKVAAHFRDLDYVDDIEVIPSVYLRPRGSFANLEQIRTMYDIDLIALVSYDQIQFTDEGMLSLTYWTIVGAYVVQGEKNDTHTMLDTAVYDIESQKMLLRAPGISNIKGSATIVNLSEELRRDSLRGFEQAADDMIVNLEAALERLQDKIKAEPEKIKIVQSTSSTRSTGGGHGGGAFGVYELLAALAILLAGAGTRITARRVDRAGCDGRDCRAAVRRTAPSSCPVRDK